MRTKSAWNYVQIRQRRVGRHIEIALHQISQPEGLQVLQRIVLQLQDNLRAATQGVTTGIRIDFERALVS